MAMKSFAVVRSRPEPMPVTDKTKKVTEWPNFWLSTDHTPDVGKLDRGDICMLHLKARVITTKDGASYEKPNEGAQSEFRVLGGEIERIGHRPQKKAGNNTGKPNDGKRVMEEY